MAPNHSHFVSVAMKKLSATHDDTRCSIALESSRPLDCGFNNVTKDPIIWSLAISSKAEIKGTAPRKITPARYSLPKLAHISVLMLPKWDQRVKNLRRHS
jgi:hypothetical protein